MQGALCWGPVDELVDIVVADKYKLSTVPSDDGPRTTPDPGTPRRPRTRWWRRRISRSRACARPAITIVAADLFGGKDARGRRPGTLRFYFGSTTQNANAT
jgi:hypothetical protein